jgi:anti-sigma regulatory factor (Ser/Thr protein kinase)
MQDFRLSLADRPESSSVMREYLRAWLDRAHVEREIAAEVVSACTEAFNNAILHPLDRAPGAIDMTASLQDRILRITVRDRGHWRESSGNQVGGFGLPLMRSLMDSVDITPTTQGTTLTLGRALPNGRG